MDENSPYLKIKPTMVKITVDIVFSDQKNIKLWPFFKINVF